MPPLRLVVADADLLVRVGLQALLNDEPDLRVVADVADPVDAVRASKTAAAHVLLTKICFHGAHAATELTAAAAVVPVVVVSAHTSLRLVRIAVQAGVSGYVLKRATPEVLFAAIRHAAVGERYLDPAVGALFAAAAGGPLSAREHDVLHLIAAGSTNAEIAQQLFVSQRTIEAARASLRAKLQLRTRADLFAYAREHGLEDHHARPGVPR